MGLFLKNGAILLALIPVAIQAQCDLNLNTDGEYLISSYADLNVVGVGDCLPSDSYRLTANIDATASKTENGGLGFKGIGSTTLPFSGKFHGAGHTISNLWMQQPMSDYVGMFPSISNAQIDSLNLVQVRIQGRDYLGGLAGYANKSQISHVRVEGVVVGSYVAGLLSGFAFDTKIDTCETHGNVQGGGRVGGIVGSVEGVSLTQSFSTATVTGRGTDVGGLLGAAFSATVLRNYANGVVSSSYSVGGLIGYAYNTTVENSYSLATVFGLGRSAKAGGVVGESYYTNFKTSYAAGLVQVWGGTGVSAGIVANYTAQAGDLFTSVYFDQAASRQVYSIVPTNNVPSSDGALSGTQMRLEANFAGFDFSSVWEMGSSYPYLRGMKNAPMPGPLPTVQATKPSLPDLASASYEQVPMATLLAVWSKEWSRISTDLSATWHAYRIGYVQAPQDTLWGAVSYVPVTFNANQEIPIADYTDLKMVGIAYPLSANYRLTSDIDASASAQENCDTNGCKGFLPIASDTLFTGKLHGANHVIRNLHLQDQSLFRAGLVANLGSLAVIDSLGLENAWIEAGSNTGGIAGYSEGTIKNCYVTGSVLGSYYTGGIIGKMGAGELMASYSSVKAISDAFVGGLVGALNGGSIHDVYVNGITSPMSGSTSNSNGGLVGYWDAGTIQRALVLGPVQANRPVDVNNSTTTGMKIFWGRDISGLTTGISSTALLDANTFVGFDLVNLWEIPTGTGALHPVLRGMKNAPSSTNHVATQPSILYSTLKGYYEEQPTATLVARKLGISNMNVDQDSLVTIFQIGVVRAVQDTLWGGFGRSARATIPGLGMPIASYEDLLHIGFDWPIGGDYYLESDIDASASSDGSFSPIGETSDVFYGHFRGRGFVIRNLSIQKKDDNSVGLFAATSPNSIIDSLGMENVQVIGHNVVGGLVGKAWGLISECYVTGKVVLNGFWDVGGLVGNMSSGGKILNSYTTAEVVGDTYTGGMVGNNNGYLQHVYAAGIMNTGGGLVGFQGKDTATVKNVWDKTVSERTTDDAVNSVGLTTAQMKQTANYTGWDFQKVWYMENGRTYPLLRAFMKPMTIRAEGLTKTYDGNAFVNPVFTMVPATPDPSKFTGTLTNTGSSLNAKNKGTYNITPGGIYTTGQHGYAIDYSSGKLNVSAKEIVLSGISAKNKVIDGSADAEITGTPVLTGVVKGDSISVSGTPVGEFESASVGTDIPVIVSGYILDGVGAGNYYLTLPIDLVADITKGSSMLRESRVALSGYSQAKVLDVMGQVVWIGVIEVQKGRIALPAGLQSGRWIVQLRMENHAWQEIVVQP